MATPVGALLAILRLDPAQFEAGLSKAERLTKAAGKRMESIGRSLSAAITLPLAGVATIAVKTSADIETALAGVQKETDASAAQVAAFGENIVQLSTQIPVVVTELAKIGETALELGAPIEGLEKLTETAARFGSVAEISGERSAGALIQLSRALGEPIDEADRLASAIVAL